MAPEIARIIAPLPPKGSVAARHAGRVIYHLDQARWDVRPATTCGPAYTLEKMCFAPKAGYHALRSGLIAEAPAQLLLYPEGLDFREISQTQRWHRWLEGYRRLGLVWRLLNKAGASTVVYRPRLLKRKDHLMIVATALLAKAFHPRRVRLRRQSTPPHRLVAPILGHTPLPCTDESADRTSLELAVKHGAKGILRLTPLWLQSALNRLPKSDPVYGEISNLAEVIRHFGPHDLPVLGAPEGYITAAPFKDAPTAALHGVVLSSFMHHLHRANRLSKRFRLDNAESLRAYRQWYASQAPQTYPHALFADQPEPISADLSAAGVAQALRLIIKNARFFGAAAGVAPALKAWLNTPVSPEVTRLQFLLATLAHAPLSSPQELQTPWRVARLSSWYAARAFASYPMLAELSELTPPAPPATWQVTGESKPDTGLGQNRQMSESALLGFTAKRRFYLHHVNADSIPAKMMRHHTPGAFHIGYLLWEMEKTPAAHRLAGEVLDEIWAPTRYVQRIYQHAYARPVTHIGKGFDLPLPVPFSLGRFGISAGQPVFLLSFDLHSSVARKNPLAAVLAFQMAFEGNKEARLIIKTSKPLKNHWGDPERQMSIIRKLMAKDKRIILFQEHLPFARYLGLISAVTALVSPHRAEGFGYLPAYAMKLGTPVIATDYAGTQDFCTAKTALPVPWRPRLVRPGEPIYPLDNAHWAEIDHEALARAMQDILANPEAAKTRALAGKALMESDYTLAAQRTRYRARLTKLGLI